MHGQKKRDDLRLLHGCGVAAHASGRGLRAVCRRRCGFAYHYAKGSSVKGMTGATYHQFASRIDYFVSKRTDVYLICSGGRRRRSHVGRSPLALPLNKQFSGNGLDHLRIALTHKLLGTREQQRNGTARFVFLKPLTGLPD